MSARTVRNLFIAVLIFLPLQYILVGVVGYFKTEPWPAFVFPGFKNIYVQDNIFLIPQTHFELYDSNDELIDNHQAYRFFSDIPRSQISGFMNIHFSDTVRIEQLSPEAKNWLKASSIRLTDQPVSFIKIIRTTEHYRRFEAGLEVDSVDYQFTAVIQLDDL